MRPYPAATAAVVATPRPVRKRRARHVRVHVSVNSGDVTASEKRVDGLCCFAKNHARSVADIEHAERCEHVVDRPALRRGATMDLRQVEGVHEVPRPDEPRALRVAADVRREEREIS